MVRFLLPGMALIGSCAASPLPPPPPQNDARYVYYLHGKIVEDLGPRGVSPRFGAYDLPGIVDSFKKEGLATISEVRPRDTDVTSYAEHVVADVRRRIGSGVPPSHITIVGASKGAVIAALVSARLQQPGVRYVLLASCNDWLIKTHELRLSGEVLSIYEATDDIAQSCEPLAKESPDIARFSEIRLNTGLGHGVVYRPLQEWVAPAVAWAKR